MLKANFSRAEYSPRFPVTCVFQIVEHFTQSEGNMPFDVLEETHIGQALLDSFEDVRPEMSFVFVTFS